MDSYPKAGSIIDRKYKVMDILGEGGTAIVLKCEDKLTGKTYALKRFLKDKMTPTLKSRIFDEAKLNVNSYYLAHGIKAFKSRGYFHLLLPYLPGNDLSTILTSENTIDEVTAVYFLLCMTQAVSDLNATNPTIIVTDLKPENSRLLPNGKIVIFDLSCFEYVNKKPEISQGTPPYAAPELSLMKPLSLSTDIYSLGIVLFEMLIGREKFNTIYDKWDLDKKRGYKVDVSAVKNIYPNAWQIIDRCVEPDPANRYRNADELLSVLTPYYRSLSENLSTLQNTTQAKPSKTVILICQSGKQLCLRTGTTVIGRNQIDPYNFYISEKHCEIKIDNNSQIKIRDIGSTCGTIVNGQSITKQWRNLNHTDVIQLANIPIQVRIA